MRRTIALLAGAVLCLAGAEPSAAASLVIESPAADSILEESPTVTVMTASDEPGAVEVRLRADDATVTVRLEEPTDTDGERRWSGGLDAGGLPNGPAVVEARPVTEDADGSEAAWTGHDVLLDLAPPAPQAAVELQDGAVSLAWTIDGVPDLTGFHVDRAPDNGDFAKVAELGADATGWRDDASEPGVQRYRVTAFRHGAGDEPRSASTVVDVTVPAAEDCPDGAVSDEDGNAECPDGEESDGSGGEGSEDEGSGGEGSEGEGSGGEGSGGEGSEGEGSEGEGSGGEGSEGEGSGGEGSEDEGSEGEGDEGTGGADEGGDDPGDETPDGGGGNTDGGNTEGGNTEGGNTEGGNTEGGNTAGRNTAGRNTEGGKTDGGNTAGGNTDGGKTDGGKTEGGKTEGGNTAGGNTDGGNTDGGKTDGGKTEGGKTDGGKTDGGKDRSGGDAGKGPQLASVGTDAPRGGGGTGSNDRSARQVPADFAPMTASSLRLTDRAVDAGERAASPMAPEVAPPERDAWWGRAGAYGGPPPLMAGLWSDSQGVEVGVPSPLAAGPEGPVTAGPEVAAPAVAPRESVETASTPVGDFPVSERAGMLPVNATSPAHDVRLALLGLLALLLFGRELRRALARP